MYHYLCNCTLFLKHRTCKRDRIYVTEHFSSIFKLFLILFDGCESLTNRIREMAIGAEAGLAQLAGACPDGENWRKKGEILSQQWDVLQVT